jgi:hypothetical protein
MVRISPLLDIPHHVASSVTMSGPFTSVNRLYAKHTNCVSRFRTANSASSSPARAGFDLLLPDPSSTAEYSSPKSRTGVRASVATSR